MNKSNQEWIDSQKEKYIKKNRMVLKDIMSYYAVLIFLSTIVLLFNTSFEYWYVCIIIAFVGIVIQVSLYFDSVYKINEIANSYKIEVEKIEREFAKNENTNI
jgi:hypothetical protein